MTKSYNLKRINKFLTEGFDVDELHKLCLFEQDFEPLFNKVKRIDDQSKVIIEILDYAKKRGLLDALLNWGRNENRRLYKAHSPYEVDEGDSEPEPILPQPTFPTLAETIQSKGWFVPEDAVHLIIELCNTVADLPMRVPILNAENLLYATDETPTLRIKDEDLSSLKETEADVASIALNLGQLLYQMLTQIVPGETVIRPSEINQNVPPSLDWIVLQSLSSNAFLNLKDLQQSLEIFLAGNGLRDKLASGYKFPASEAIWQAIRLCNHLERHHSQGLAHQHLTSDYVILNDMGGTKRAQWLDAVLVETNNSLPACEATDDVYAVGIILYEMLTSQLLTENIDRETFLAGASLDVRLGLDQIVLRALASDPTERYQDVVVLRERLFHHLPRLRYAQEIDDLIRASYPVIYLVSWEEERVLRLLEQIAENQGKPLRIWSASQGLKDAQGKSIRGARGLEDPAKMLDHFIKTQEAGLWILFDFHPYLRQISQTSEIRRQVRDAALESRRTAKSLVIISPVVEIPPECDKDITLIHFGLPTPGEMADILDDTIRLIQESGGQVQLSRNDYEELIRSATGLTLREAERAFTLASMRKQGILDPDAIEIILGEKAQILLKSSALEIFPASENFGDIGGLVALKDWAAVRAKSFTIEAQDFGLPAPKGVLLVGVPGCGKSLAAKAIASEWKMPLLKLDTGALFSAQVGSSEDNLRNAIQVSEAVAPCILWIDEIEKSFSGIQSANDGGVAARVFGGLITWLQEKTEPVFVVATANTIGDLSSNGNQDQSYSRSGGLPPELLRKGRFDELFFIDLPDHEERKRIFAIHLEKRGHDPTVFDLDKLAEASEDYSGAEIEQAILSALYEAFSGLDYLYKIMLVGITNPQDTTNVDLETFAEEMVEKWNFSSDLFAEFQKKLEAIMLEFSRLELERGLETLLTSIFKTEEEQDSLPNAAKALQNIFDWWTQILTSENLEHQLSFGLSQRDLIRGLKQVYPLSLIMRPQIEALRDWAEENTRSASQRPEVETVHHPGQSGVHFEPS